ncbi:MAG: PAS domain S-box protein, partial [Thiobacillus sp.]|nr:PAS domain S-box protein [Thiobacillus sp.]
MGALLLILIAVFVLAGQQALQIARQDADAALRVQASAQLAALSQAVADSAIMRDYSALQAQLKTPIVQGNLRYVEYTAPNGYALREQAPARRADRPDWFATLTGLSIPVMQEALVIGGTAYGRLVIQPSSHAYEDFLWHLGTRLFLLLATAFVLLGWLTHVLLKINLRDLIRLRATARQIEAGDYRARIPIRASSPPELQQTTRAFNHMSAALERLLTDLNEQQKALDSTASMSEADLAGNITFANDLFCIISGYTREELHGQNHRIVNSGWHDAAFFAQMWETLSSGRTWRGEICNRAKDGRLFWTDSTFIPIKDDDGLPLKYLSIRFDITQRKLDEAALCAEKERWQVTLQSINDAVIVTNAHNQVTYINPAAEALLNIAQEEAQSIPLQNLMQLDQRGGDD